METDGNNGDDGNKNPNYNYNDIRKEIVDATPNPIDFGGGDPYSDEEVARDLKKLEEIKSRPEYKDDGPGISDAKIQEYATAFEIADADWFSDDIRTDELFEGGQSIRTSTNLTSEFDDHVNHIDAICVMNNIYSDYKPLPFALDMTYNTSGDGLYQKFHWKHPSKEVDIPGFCMAKYFDDPFSFSETLPKGKIAVMPRFVVGFDPDLSEKIASGRISATAWDDLSREEPSEKAKFCVLKELALQADQTLEYLTAHEDEKPIFKDLIKQMDALKKYFDGALEVAEQNDPHDFKSYPSHDQVYLAITSNFAF